jgi:hypothetical protein
MSSAASTCIAGNEAHLWEWPRQVTYYQGLAQKQCVDCLVVTAPSPAQQMAILTEERSGNLSSDACSSKDTEGFQTLLDEYLR